MSDSIYQRYPSNLIIPNCPYCRRRLEWLPGWEEVGDRTVEIQVLGCAHCGLGIDDFSSEDYIAAVERLYAAISKAENAGRASEGGS